MTIPKQQHPEGFPACISLSIKFNQHAVFYQTPAEWWADLVSLGCEPTWASAEDRQRAFETNSVWTCQWYPDTPVGNYSAAASSFDALMALVNSQTKDAE